MIKFYSCIRFNCPKCGSEQYEGECYDGFSPVDEGQPCYICEKCDYIETYEDKFENT